MAPKVLVSDKLSETAVQIFRDRGIEVDFRPELGKDKDKLAEVIGDYDGLAIRSATKVTEKILANATNLKVIARAGIGTDNIDKDAASRKGVIVMNTPFGNMITTAEHAIAMMFAVARQIPEASASTHAGKWEKSRFMGVELTGKTLGVIGAGNIGGIVCDRARGLKMKVIAYDPFLGEEKADKMGVEKVELDELLKRADFITLHVPLTDQTRNILSREALEKTKKGVRIINCARGGLVDEEALADLLKSGHVAGAGFDVFAVEPATENPLFGLPNVVCTPHLGAATTEAQENVALQVAEQMSDYLLTGAVTNALNMPSVTAEEAKVMGPWIKLAGHLGNFVGQMTDEPIKAINILFDGVASEMNLGALTSAAVAGIMKSVNRGGQGTRCEDQHHQAGQVRRLRGLYQADRRHRQARTLDRRDGVQRRQAALHPDQGHQYRCRDRAAHALYHQRGRARHHRHAGSDHGRERRQHRQLHPGPLRGGGRGHRHPLRGRTGARTGHGRAPGDGQVPADPPAGIRRGLSRARAPWTASPA
jgi:D-3-phosphoglycerate dehydrogenase